MRLNWVQVRLQLPADHVDAVENLFPRLLVATFVGSLATSDADRALVALNNDVFAGLAIAVDRGTLAVGTLSDRVLVHKPHIGRILGGRALHDRLFGHEVKDVVNDGAIGVERVRLVGAPTVGSSAARGACGARCTVGAGSSVAPVCGA